MKEAHPLANLFPSLSKARFDELVEDVKKHGQRQPIIYFEGKILDGRQRYAACLEAGIKPFHISFESLPDEYVRGGPLAYILSENLHRRHLRPSEYKKIHQVLVPRLQQQLQEGAVKRNGEARSVSDDTKRDSLGRPNEGRPPQTFKREAVKLAAQMTGTSARAVYRNLSKPRPKPKGDMTAGLKPTDSIRKLIKRTEKNGGSLYIEIGGHGIRCMRMGRIRGGCVSGKT